MNALYITLIGITLIFLMTTLGASVVFLLKKDISPTANSILLGFASGVMIEASILSLLIPAIEMCKNFENLSFLPIAVSLLAGAAFLFAIDKICKVVEFKKKTKRARYKNTLKNSMLSNQKDALKNSILSKHSQRIYTDEHKKSLRFFLAVSIHNIPEGLAVGFALGAATLINTQDALLSALALSIGIGIQNFPEGATVALPFVKTLKSRTKAFLLGTLSGLVEPIFAVVGYFLASSINVLQPWLLPFAVGAMLYVVFDDLIPESKNDKLPHLAALCAIVGFILMFIIDSMF